jgi:hypothetical protein
MLLQFFGVPPLQCHGALQQHLSFSDSAGLSVTSIAGLSAAEHGSIAVTQASKNRKGPNLARTSASRTELGLDAAGWGADFAGILSSVGLNEQAVTWCGQGLR